MKKSILFAAIFAALLPFAAACTTTPDICDFISENRSNIYLYKDDTTEVTVWCVKKEQPFNTDGICGELCDLVEIYVSLDKNPETLEVKLDSYSGEMNYQAVENRFSVSYSREPFNEAGIDLVLYADGEEKPVRALTVKDAGLISPEQAVDCAREYDSELFESLTDRAGFNGEIFVRLLYDEGCYYYVGVCDRDRNISAYLIDGTHGKIIATKKLKA